MTSHDPQTAPWWTARPALTRFVADLVAAELGALRHAPFMRANNWTDALSLEHDLALDSLEFMQVAGALSLALQMHHSGIEDYLLARRTLGDWVDIAQAALAQHDSTLVFSSSGSTGQPKSCSHRLDRLEQEAQSLAALFPGRRRLLAAVPSHHIYGFLCTQLLPRHLGIDPGQVVVIRARLPSTLAHLARSGDLVIGHPQFWQAALAPGHAFPPDVVGVSSTAPCPDEVAEAAARCGIATLFQLYGASETAGLGWRSSHREDYRLHAYLERDPDGEGGVRRRLPDGGSEALQVQDRLAWTGERTFAVGARRDGAVQVGGVNVYPERVREVLLRHPDVLDASVRLMRPGQGTRLKAFIVRRDGAPANADATARLRAWIDEQLSPPERPKALTFGDTLPRSAMGKPADWDIE